MAWLDFSLLDLALVGAVALSWVAVFMALYCMKRLRTQSQLTQKLYARLNHELEVTNTGSIGMGRRLMSLEKKLTAAASQTEENKQQLEGSFEPYTLAAQMIDAGIDDVEVARRCGLSRAEASLMQMMHKQVKQAA
jgi:hypothetical protein